MGCEMKGFICAILVLTLASVVLTHAQVPKDGQWEYKVFSVERNADKTIEKTLNALSTDGWELVTVTALGYGGGRYEPARVFLRRHK